MSVRYCANEAPRVYVFTGDQPWDVMKEAAKFLRKAAKSDEFLTQWTIHPDSETLLWVGTLTTSGAGESAAQAYLEGYEDALRRKPPF